MKKLVAILLTIGTVSSAQAQNCPGIAVESSSYEVPMGDTLVFVVNTKNAPANVTYNWVISAGTIISGQGTAMIKVNTKDLEGMFVTATVDLGGLPRNCNSSASSTTEIIPAAQLILSGTFTSGQELKNAVQKFITLTKLKDPENSGVGFIYLYKGPATTESSMKAFKAAMTSAFDQNQVFPFQYTIAEGGKKKLQTYEIYLVRQGSKDPKPSN